MHCFICVTYMIILCSTSPVTTREIATAHEKRSLFRDVIESLRIRSQLPEDINQNDENNLSQNYERYGYENEPAHLPSDSEYIPRRNDRIEMPSLKYRFPRNARYSPPKSIYMKDTDDEQPKGGLLLSIDTNVPKVKGKYRMKKRTTETTNNLMQQPINETEEAETKLLSFIITPEVVSTTGVITTTKQDPTEDIYVVIKPKLSKPTKQSNKSGRRKLKRPKVKKTSQVTTTAASLNTNTVEFVKEENVVKTEEVMKPRTEDLMKKKPATTHEINWIPLDYLESKDEEQILKSKAALLKNNVDVENNKFEDLFQILFAI
ncbi:uncharacterized protein LOC142973310 [Anticarsia gemmatalis]|uniref:uncharacterized protein LOC142973310 n=1 Tax=Anticarsia gemmatalis TaxID=129554 RepID=UPI003F76038B